MLPNDYDKQASPIMKTIRGRLTPSKIGENWEMNRKLFQLDSAFRHHNLRELTLWYGEWRDNRMVYNSVTPAYNAFTYKAHFLKSLALVLQEPEVVELDLSGNFTLFIETGKEPIMLSVVVQNGEISYKQAEYMWPSDSVKVNP